MIISLASIRTQSELILPSGFREFIPVVFKILIKLSDMLDTCREELPLAIRLFGNGYMIPGYDNVMTGFGNLGVSLMLVLMRGE